MIENQNIIKRVEEHFRLMQNVRRTIHSKPELAFKEFETSKLIANFLTSCNIRYKLVPETGIIAEIGNSENCIALRADMDALPVMEETGCEFTSTNKGVMHACGHDLHTTMLLFAAKIIKENEAQLKHRVRIIFQPAEEKLPGGALMMLKNGVLDDPVPTMIFAQHVNPEIPTGKIALNSGYVMASTDELYWSINGKSAHAAQPHLGKDPIIAAAHIITSIQSCFGRMRNPIQQSVLSVTSVQGGNTTNIIPDKVKMMGTFRSYDPHLRREMLKNVEKISLNTAENFGTTCDFVVIKGYPSLYNSPKAVEYIGKICNTIFHRDIIQKLEPKMWAEDFSYYAEKIPAAFWFLGVRNEDSRSALPLHNSKFLPDERAMINGTALFVALCLFE